LAMVVEHALAVPKVDVSGFPVDQSVAFAQEGLEGVVAANPALLPVLYQDRFLRV